MADKKYFKVRAYITSTLYAIVEANDEEEAYELAKDLDGAEFIPNRILDDDWELSTDPHEIGDDPELLKDLAKWLD